MQKILEFFSRKKKVSKKESIGAQLQPKSPIRTQPLYKLSSTSTQLYTFIHQFLSIAFII